VPYRWGCTLVAFNTDKLCRLHWLDTDCKLLSQSAALHDKLYERHMYKQQAFCFTSRVNTVEPGLSCKKLSCVNKPFFEVICWHCQAKSMARSLVAYTSIVSVGTVKPGLSCKKLRCTNSSKSATAAATIVVTATAAVTVVVQAGRSGYP